MFCELATLQLRPGTLNSALQRLEKLAGGPRLLGCWHSFLGNTPRIHVLLRQLAPTGLEALREQAVDNRGLMGLGDLLHRISMDTWSTLPCLPHIATGAFGALYEFRIYRLQPMAALDAAYQGWAEVIQTRLDIAPITTVMHSVNGTVPRLVHIYPYRDLAHRQQVREQAIATGLWPPKGGSSRNQVMAAELAVPAAFSPIH